MIDKPGVRALASALALAVLLGPAAYPQSPPRIGDGHGIRHVLLISIDGMHPLDYVNCTIGIPGVNGGLPYCPNLAALGQNGVNYLDANASKPSDSFPGLMALVTGGSPRTVGAFYDVAYDRSLDPPAKTTGNGVAAGHCTPQGNPIGTTTEYDEGIDINQNLLNGGAPSGDGGINSIDPKRLIRDPSRGCAPVYPWNFVRTNTIFGVVHEAGGYTAWSDKHPSYSSVSGPGNGTNVDDYYSPEINSIVVKLPGVATPAGMSCTDIPDPSQTSAWTNSFKNIQCYDTLKVRAILHEIDGQTHNGQPATTPTLFGMNFQAVSVGQKLIEKNVGTGGYLDSIGTPSSELLGEIRFVDDSIGEMVSHLQNHALSDSTLIIITAKHGQSPVDPKRFFPIPGPSGNNGKSPASIVSSLLPFSESPNNPNGIGPTADDVALLWLSDSNQTSNAVAMLEADASLAGIGEIFSGPALGLLFNPPEADPRTPDIIVTPNFGVIYTGSSAKLAEHGGFGHDDTNVIMLLSNPSFEAKTITSPVETAQVAPTILEALGLDPDSLQAVQKEGTQALPFVFTEDQPH
jgi:hypothetical protein